MDIVQITPPLVALLTLEEMMDHLNLWEIEPEEQRNLEAYLAAAYEHLDGRHGILSRSLLTQQWRYRYEKRLNCLSQIILPFPPLQAVTALHYLDDKDTEQSFDISNILLRKNAYQPYFCLKIGKSWPSNMQQGSLEVTYTAGYGEASKVPNTLKLVIKFLVAHWYENRVAVEKCKQHELPIAVNALLNPYRMPEFAGGC